jgi:lipopolysaccharide biosynthesis glycosyltransferase
MYRPIADPPVRSELNFVSVIDRNYVIPCSILLLSFRENNPELRATIFILHCDLTDDDCGYLQAVAGMTGIDLHFVKMPADPFSQFPTRRRSQVQSQREMPPIAYAKAFVDRFIPAHVNRAVIIDSDMVAAGSFAGVNDLLGDALLAAVASPFSFSPRHYQFNSGFMPVDLAAWRQLGIADIAERFLYDYADSLFLHDQHVLNLIFRGHWKRLPLSWNWIEKICLYGARMSAHVTEGEIDAERSKIKLIHFIGDIHKPWRHNSRHPYRDLYCRYEARLSDMSRQWSLINPRYGQPDTSSKIHDAGHGAIAQPIDRDSPPDTDAAQALDRMMDGKRALPITRFASHAGMASLDLLRHVSEHILRHRPKTIVECGCGLSSIAMADALERAGYDGHVWSLEDDRDRIEILRQELLERGLDRRVTILECPLTEQVFEGFTKPFLWYDLDRVEIPPAIDLLLVGGPSEIAGKHARYPAGVTLLPRVAPSGHVFIDEIAGGEIRLSSKWRLLHPDFGVRNLGANRMQMFRLDEQIKRFLPALLSKPSRA